MKGCEGGRTRSASETVATRVSAAEAWVNRQMRRGRQCPQRHQGDCPREAHLSETASLGERLAANRTGRLDELAGEPVTSAEALRCCCAAAYTSLPKNSCRVRGTGWVHSPSYLHGFRRATRKRVPPSLRPRIPSFTDSRDRGCAGVVETHCWTRPLSCTRRICGL